MNEWEVADLRTLLAYGMWTEVVQRIAETNRYDAFKSHGKCVGGKEVKTCQGEGCVLFALCPVECRYDDKTSITRLVLVMTTQVLPQYHAHYHFPPSPAVSDSRNPTTVRILTRLWTPQFRPRKVQLIFLLTKLCGLSLESTQPPINP